MCAFGDKINGEEEGKGEGEGRVVLERVELITLTR